MNRALACLGVFLVTLAVFDRTLLPGLDLGDTASFQAAVGSSQITPRQGYPLYFAAGDAFLRLVGGEPARTLNLFSAVAGAAAAAVLTGVAAELAGTTIAGVFGGLLFAFSYTFWSQSIIAEVYSLHLLLTGLSLSALLSWQRRPGMVRLAIFFATYALGFGNHLSMILLAPAAIAFLLLAAPEGPRSLFRLPVVLMAVGIAAIGSLQYAWNLRSLWNLPDPPDTWVEGLRALWFDVTKSDWLQSMAFAVPGAMVRGRAAMYWFDVQQQFGVPGLLLALLGATALVRSRPRAALVFSFYLASLIFAFLYNVGDVHVFLLPSHYAVALMAAVGSGAIVALASRRVPRNARFVSAAVAVILLFYPIYRAADAFAALDRSRDGRAEALLDRVASGLDGSKAIFATDFNWQIMNGLDYYTKHNRPDLPCFSLAHSMLQFPVLERSNAEIGREVVLSAGSARRLVSTFGPLYPLAIDTRVTPDSMSDFLLARRADTAYVVAFLAPLREFPTDTGRLADISRILDARVNLRELPYNVIAGRIGHPPDLVQSSRTPFRTRAQVAGMTVEVRMESWLATDTIRRAGFGHVIVNGRHALTLERGLSGIALDVRGEPLGTSYEGGLFAVELRYRLARPSDETASSAGSDTLATR